MLAVTQAIPELIDLVRTLPLGSRGARDAAAALAYLGTNDASRGQVRRQVVCLQVTGNGQAADSVHVTGSCAT